MPTNQHNQFGSDHHGEEGKSTINRSNGVVVVVENFLLLVKELFEASDLE
jgi:hypothetical protein